MAEPQESSWHLERGIGSARVTVDLIGDHLNELEDPVIIAFAAQTLEAVAIDQGVEPDKPYHLWWIETKAGHRGVAIGCDADEALSHWRQEHPGVEIKDIQGGTDVAGYI